MNVSRWESMKRRKWAIRGGEAAGLQGQRERRGRSLEFMMRLESRFKLSEDTRLIREKKRTDWHCCQVSVNRFSATFIFVLIACSLFWQRLNLYVIYIYMQDEVLTLVKVELLVGRAIPQTFDVYQVTVDIWIIQSTESHICKRRGVSPAWSALIYFLFCFPTGCLLFLDGHGQRRAVLHACRHNHLWGGHSNHGRRGGSWCRRRGHSSLLDSFFGWLGWNWDSAIFIQLPLHCALNLSSAKEDSIRTCLQLVVASKLSERWLCTCF